MANCGSAFYRGPARGPATQQPCARYLVAGTGSGGGAFQKNLLHLPVGRGDSHQLYESLAELGVHTADCCLCFWLGARRRELL